ncbi:MAG: FAD-dependent oxidoreductase [Nitrospira sp.]|nr:FAD-dependent oxidoreductase [Nitrospira sp.]
MTNYTYLIIGGGMTAAAAVDGIREVDSTGSIGLISAEQDSPYDRPPLTKGLWKGKSLDSIWWDAKKSDVTTHLGRVVREVVPGQKRVLCEDGAAFAYDKLLLATGGTPRRLPFGEDHIIYFWTLPDYHRLRALTETGQRFAVIGGGFIGSEIAAALTMNGKQVVMIFPDSDISARVFPPPLARYVTDLYRNKGIDVLTGQQPIGVERRDGRYGLTTNTKRETVVDGVIAGIGIEPNVDLAKAIGLEIEDGIIVDELLRTSRADIYAAGDAVSFYNLALETRVRVEHEDNANSMGRLAGRNMAGKSEPYHHLPFFYSDLFDLGYEAVGQTDSRLETFADWRRPNEEGVIYYLKDSRVRGVLLWNVWEQIDAARRLIAEPGPFNAENLKGRIAAEA